MMNNQVATQEASPVLANERGQANMLSLMMNVDFMASIDKMASMMASGKTTVPQHLRGNQSDCFAICLQAIQWGMNPFPVAQKTHLVNGTLGYEAQLVNAVVVNSGAIKGRFDYEFFGPWERVIGKFKVVRKEKEGKPVEYRVPDWTFADETGCGVKVIAHLASGQTRDVTLLLQQARTRNSTLWADDPKQQLAYLGVKRWARLYTPDVILGVYSVDELEEIDVTPPSDGPQGGADAKAELTRKAAERRAQQQKGQVIEGEAQVVSVGHEPAAEPISDTNEQNEPKDLEAEDLLADILFKMDLAQSGSEMKTLVTEVSLLGPRLTTEQKKSASGIYQKNVDRLGLSTKKAA
ncbi:RecT family recombinase [Aeromonas dhakensis]|uniref:RecT family recombinase n=1 Tax=Aeromonas dhakensis TaxID=196024 RepID=UPI0029D8A74D|nr:RecT family recombinase [Aeromonas dhakensis]MDX7829982.1 RecT family recombinase [Aeromonas dhakensis]